MLTLIALIVWLAPDPAFVKATVDELGARISDAAAGRGNWEGAGL
jgi:hypothetical protein